jgi:hypothetical protein
VHRGVAAHRDEEARLERDHGVHDARRIDAQRGAPRPRCTRGSRRPGRRSSARSATCCTGTRTAVRLAGIRAGTPRCAARGTRRAGTSPPPAEPGVEARDLVALLVDRLRSPRTERAVDERRTAPSPTRSPPSISTRVMISVFGSCSSSGATSACTVLGTSTPARRAIAARRAASPPTTSATSSVPGPDRVVRVVEQRLLRDADLHQHGAGRARRCARPRAGRGRDRPRCRRAPRPAALRRERAPTRVGARRSAACGS